MSRCFFGVISLFLSALASAEDLPKVNFFFRDKDVREVAAKYQEFTGAKVIAAGRNYGTVSVLPNGLITKARAIELIEETLFAAGYNIIELQPGTIRILAINDQVTKLELPVISKPEDLPEKERVVTYVYEVRSRKLAEFAATLKLIFVESTGGLLEITPDEIPNTLRITARTSAIRNFLRLAGELDPPAKK